MLGSYPIKPPEYDDILDAARASGLHVEEDDEENSWIFDGEYRLGTVTSQLAININYQVRLISMEGYPGKVFCFLRVRSKFPAKVDLKELQEDFLTQVVAISSVEMLESLAPNPGIISVHEI